MTDTALVSVLVAVGIRQRRAAAFERWLDDKQPYGFSADMLADLFHRHAQRQMAVASLMEAHDVQFLLFSEKQKLDASRAAEVRKQM